MKFEGKNNEYFELVEVDYTNCNVLKKSKQHELSLLWFNTNGNKLLIDGELHNFDSGDMVCLTEFHNVQTVKVHGLRLLRFNRSFYCVLDHDDEVSCKGVLYFGSSNVPIIRPVDDDQKVLETVWKMLSIEMKTRDNLQLEMLQMMLKRILILCTRIYKKQINYTQDGKELDIVRNFNFLVEKHFKEFHQVADYAKLLHKSPKTIANIFNKTSDKTPLTIIKDRIVVEAKRMLLHSDRSASEIAYELGFSDIQSFSRFFKNLAGVSPSKYKSQIEVS